MEKSLSDLTLLQTLLSNEYINYKQAIMQNKGLAEVKTIYVNIKELQKEIDKLTMIFKINSRITAFKKFKPFK